MNASISRAVVVGCLLLAIGAFLPGCKREPVPEYFGIWFQSSQGLREIPMKGDPAFKAAEAKLPDAVVASKNDSELHAAIDSYDDSCQKANEQPTFILYHDTIKPQMLRLQGGQPTKDVGLGIAPVADKQFMYRLTRSNTSHRAFMFL